MRRALALTSCLVLLPAPTVVPAAGPERSGRLEVHGKDLRFDGKPVRLRGLAVGDPIQSRQGRPTADDYRVIARDWKANVVRIAVHPLYWKTMEHAGVLNRLAEDVDAALANGLFVVIEYKAIGWPDGYHEVPTWGGPEDLYDSDFKLAETFWDAAARRWGKDGRIMFELWNEPVFTKEDWRPEVGQKWPEFKPFLAKLLTIVRRQSENVVIVSSNRWSSFLKGLRADPLHGDNIAYAWHVYPNHSKNDPKQWADALDDLQTVAPVIVTEWGFERETKSHWKGNPDDFGRPFVRDFLEAKGLHSTAWCWHPVSGPAMLEKDWRTPNEFGAFVRDYLRGHNP